MARLLLFWPWEGRTGMGGGRQEFQRKCPVNRAFVCEHELRQSSFFLQVLLGPVAGKAPRELRVAGPCGKTLVFVLPNFRAQDRPKRSHSQWFDPFARSSWPNTDECLLRPFLCSPIHPLWAWEVGVGAEWWGGRLGGYWGLFFPRSPELFFSQLHFLLSCSSLICCCDLKAKISIDFVISIPALE